MRLSSSMSGMWKRGMVWIVRHRQTKEPVTDRPSLNHRATSRLYSTNRRDKLAANGVAERYGLISSFHDTS